MGRLEQLSSRLHNKLGRALKDHHLIEDGDHVLVCLSGGKDSYSLLTLLMENQARSPVNYTITAFHLDQKQPGYPEGVIGDYLATVGIPYVIRGEDTYSVVKEKLPEGATPCSLCSRLRRGIIYATAEEYGCNKIALGHHRDDSVETLLLNMFHTGQLQGMPAGYTTDDGRFQVIRPLIYVAEADIAEYAQLQGYPIIPCTLCGSAQTQRVFVKGLLDELEQRIPHVRNSILAAMTNVRSTHLLDRDLLEKLDGAPRRPARGIAAACQADDQLF